MDLIVVKENTKRLSLKGYDAVLPRINIMGGLEDRLDVIKVLEGKRMPILNTYASVILAKDKILTYKALNKHKVPQPKTSVIKASKNLSAAAKHAKGYPLILKHPCGSYGHGVILAESERSARSVVDHLCCPWGGLQEVLVQEFIEEAKNADLRLFVVRGKVIASMRRTAQKGEFRSNVELGGSTMEWAPTSEQVKIALGAAKALGLDVAGVDILESKSGSLVIEVNANPGFHSLEKTTGVNVAGLMVEALVEKSLQSR